MIHYRMLLVVTMLCAMSAFQAQETLYSTSWENPPFSAGQSAGGIEGWSAGTGAGASQTVSLQQARTGTQSLEWDNLGALSQTYSIGRGIRPLTPSEKLVVSTYVWISSATQENRLYGLYLTSSAEGLLENTVLGITIDGDGKVRAGTTWEATFNPGDWIDQASPDTYTDRWLRMELTLDRGSGVATATIEGFSDGLVVSVPLLQMAVPGGVALGTDYVGTTSRAGTAYFDDLLIRVEPASPLQGWNEIANGGGDAGDLPATAQKVHITGRRACTDSVDFIAGVNEENDVDMFVLCITNPSAFRASLLSTDNGSAGFDTQLWLFRCDGQGVAFNDDSAGTTFSRLDNSTGCISESGVYLLAISQYNRDAVDTNGRLLWTNTPFTGVRCPPNGPGGANPVAGWQGATPAGGTYIISLRGASFVSPDGCLPCVSHNGDADNNGCIDDADLLLVLFAFGNTGANLGRTDINCDGTVDDADLLTVLFNFGEGC